MRNLKLEYERLLNLYVDAFCEWIGFENPDIRVLSSEYDTLISINDEYFLSLDDIRYILHHPVSAKVFFKWWNYCLEVGMVGLKPPTLPEFTAKDFKPISKREIKKIEAAQASVEKAKLELEKLYDSHRGKA